MRSSVLATFALTTGFIALIYTACGKNSEKLAASPTLQQSAVTEFHKMEITFGAMKALHKHMVEEHAAETGSVTDVQHLQLEQQHLAFFEGFQDVIAKHKLFVLHPGTDEDSSSVRNQITAMQNDARNMQDAMAKIKTDHAAMLNAHRQQ